MQKSIQVIDKQDVIQASIAQTKRLSSLHKDSLVKPVDIPAVKPTETKPI